MFFGFFRVWAATGHRILERGLLKMGFEVPKKYSYLGHAAIAGGEIFVYFLLIGSRGWEGWEWQAVETKY